MQQDVEKFLPQNLCCSINAGMTILLFVYPFIMDIWLPVQLFFDR